MAQDTKIATCSYCGRRAVLRLSARGGHELACGSCGAPLHEMKWLRPPEARSGARKRSPAVPAPQDRRDTGKAAPRDRRDTGKAAPRDRRDTGKAAPRDRREAQDTARAGTSAARRPKPRKPAWRRALEEAVDLIEDIFD